MTLTGREPIETADAPNFVPKGQARYYSEAIIANGAGRILAGLFYLRTLIEQHMRSVVTDKRLRGDELTKAYADTLDWTTRASQSRAPFGLCLRRLNLRRAHRIKKTSIRRSVGYIAD
ncbi:MAG: hypothetical protein ACLQU2_22675, partial [Candidatus Binataceae bacterium]